MKRTTKSITSVLFALAMLLGMMPVSAFAAATDTAATPTVAATTDAAATVAPTTGAAATEWSAFLMYSAAEKVGWETYEDKGFNATPFIGDGVYTVTLKGSDLGVTGDPQTPQVFCVDIPGFAQAMVDSGKTLAQINNYTDETASHDASKHFQPTDLTITAEVYVDGNKVSLKDDKINYGDIEEKGTFRMELFNIWGLHAAANITEAPIMADAILPTDEIKVVFTIQGTGFNTEAGAQQIADAQAAAVTPTTAVAPTTAAAETSSTDSTDGGLNTGVIIGIVAALVVVVIVVIVVVSKKKK